MSSDDGTWSDGKGRFESIILDGSNSFVGETSFEYFSPFQLSRMPTHLSKNDCSRVKNQLKSALRIGSGLYIGENHSRAPLSESAQQQIQDKNVSKSSEIAHVHVMPMSLLKAREQGACDTSMRYARQRHFFGNHFPDFNSDQRLRLPIVQSFQNHIQGNLWSVSSFHLDSLHQQHTGCVNAINFNNSGNLIVSGSDDLSVAITNTHTGDLVARFNSGHSLNVFQVKFVPQSQDLQVITAARDGLVRLASLHPDGQSLATTRKVAKHDGACHKVAFCHDDSSSPILLSAGEDGVVYSIDLRENRKPTRILNLPLSSFYSVATNPTRPSQYCVCGRSEHVVRVFDRRHFNPPSLANPTGSGKTVPLLSFSPGHLSNRRHRRYIQQKRRRRRVEVGSDDIEEKGLEIASTTARQDEESDRMEEEEDSDADETSVIMRRMAPFLGGEILANEFDPHGEHFRSRYSVTAAVYSAQGDAILASYNDEDIYLFNSQDDTLPHIHTYRGHKNYDTVKGVNFYGPNSEYVVSGSDDGFVYIWDRHSEGIVQWLCGDINGAVNVLEPHPSLPLLATSGCDYNFKIWAPRPDDDSDFSQPETWLRTIKHPEVGRAPLYDPSSIVKSMKALRGSRLARRIFTANGVDKADGKEGISSAKQRRLSVDAADGAAPSASSSSQISKSSSNTDRKDTNRARVEGGGGESAAEAAQEHLPFNLRDLKLRVAANWAMRSRDIGNIPFSVSEMFRLIPALRVPTLSSQNGDSDVMGEDGNDEERNINMVVRMDDSSESDNSDDDRLGEIARVWRNRNDSAGTGISVPSDPALSEETPSGRVAGEGDGNDVEIYSISTWSSCSSSSSSSSTSTSVVSSDSSGPVTHNNNNEEEENEAE